jgi:hypothetical protein
MGTSDLSGDWRKNLCADILSHVISEGYLSVILLMDSTGLSTHMLLIFKL